MDVMPFLYLIGAFLLGFIIAWFAGRGGPVYELEKASAEIESLRRKVREVEDELRKMQGQLRENLATLDEMAEERKALVQQLKVASRELAHAKETAERLRMALEKERDARLLLTTELVHTRGALSAVRQAAVVRRATRRGETASDDSAGAFEIEESAEEQKSTTALAERPQESDLSDRVVELEHQLALARAAADRLAEKEALVAAELFLRRREYRDILAGGEDAITAALAARDRALANAQNELDYLRRDLSMLTAMGAQLAAALEKRNSEYVALRNRIASEETSRRLEAALLEMQPSEEALSPVDGPGLNEALAARTAELDELRSEYERLKTTFEQAFADREALQQALDARTAEVGGLNDQIAAIRAELQALLAERDALAQRLQTRVDFMNRFLERIDGYDAELRSLLARVDASLPQGASTAIAPDVATESSPVAPKEEGESHAG
ncbi:MAG: hypothetical protein NZ553_00025 [Caldilinea sp.]|nr:hypothetical protein [Caldilinea sp.]MDW8438833.1 hypothetical protein [Caldilineaceae bacterium]